MYIQNPWHGVHFGEQAPATVNALIEIPKGSKVKYELDKPSGLLKMDRIIYSSFHYPMNYGFIPQTLARDGDPLDILVMCSESIQALCLVEARVLGNMQMIDSGLHDDKIIAVAIHDPAVNYIHSLDEVPQHHLSVLRNYFEQYKVLESKEVQINDFQGKEKAYTIIRESIEAYREKYPKEQ